VIRPEMQKFVGALRGHARKGIFITSDFSARSARHLPPRPEPVSPRERKDAITRLSRPGYVPLCVPDITANHRG
jgi:restriction endonuclease Mrr